jgi:hypothetical protein
MSKTFAQGMADAYIEAFFFADCGEDGQPDTDAELAPITRLQIERDCARFIALCEWRNPDLLLGLSDEKLGHDFYYTRNGHGVGFWEGEIRGYTEEQAKALSDLSRIFGNADYYQGDDGLIYAE